MTAQGPVPSRRFTVVVTGGVASGKSAVCERLAARGVPVVDADVAARAVVADCIGGAKGYAWTNGGQGVLEAIGTDKPITSKYGSNNCPDKGANSMFSYAKS